ncbi:hypothetical protein KC19_4G214600 [Ceratodon purpureus]|uniref:Uncharacterized protein n=1 Tax=Ceratodon purpureus TaxID=3225 RepID=A0A8T0IB90_CERPU|nr:hypothetical protein KC19_4G214600 [Ceratodon purpureus]
MALNDFFNFSPLSFSIHGYNCISGENTASLDNTPFSLRRVSTNVLRYSTKNGKSSFDANIVSGSNLEAPGISLLKVRQLVPMQVNSR